MLATVVATTATLSSNSSNSASFLYRILLPFYGNSSLRTIRFLGKRTVTGERSHKEKHGSYYNEHTVSLACLQGEGRDAEIARIP